MSVTVCVPRLAERDSFFHGFVEPSIEWNTYFHRQERGPESAAWKRNRMAEASDPGLLFFCDDDVVLRGDAINSLWGTLTDYGASFAYCDYLGIDLTGEHPLGPVWTHKAGHWNPERLKRGNYISTMSLVRRDAFLEVGGFDEDLERFQDWDLWLRMAAAGHRGAYVPEVLFHAYYLPGSSITSDVDYQEARRLVEEKNGL